MSYELTGRLQKVMETQTFGGGFQKREFVVLDESNSKYPQSVAFELHKDNVDIVDSYVTDAEVTVTFDIRGREYNGRYFNNLVAFRIAGDTTAAYKAPDVAHPPSQESSSADEFQDMEDIPF